MSHIADRESAFKARAGEHPMMEESATTLHGKGIRQQAMQVLMDRDFPQFLERARLSPRRHPSYEQVGDRVATWAWDLGLLGSQTSSYEDDRARIGNAVRDILLFPALAMRHLEDDELEVLGKLWAFVFHVDDEFDEVVSAAISREVKHVCSGSVTDREQTLALDRMSRHYERLARSQTDDYVRIFDGTPSRLGTPSSAAATAIRTEILHALRRRHGVDGPQAQLMLRPFADSFYRLFDVRTAEIRQRVNTHLETSEYEYHSMRLYTIAMEPLFEISFLFQSQATRDQMERLRRSVAFQQIADATKLQISYVNDLVSIGKELREPNVHNAAIRHIVRAVGRDFLEEMIAAYATEPEQTRDELRRRINDAVNRPLQSSIEVTIRKCNELLLEVVTQAGLLDETNPASEIVAQTMFSWIEAHFLYAFEVARYSETIPYLLAILTGTPLPLWDVAAPPYRHAITPLR